MLAIHNFSELKSLTNDAKIRSSLKFLLIRYYIELIFLSCSDYPSVLQTAVDGRFDLQGLRELEEDLIKAFNDKSQSATWREGTLKSSFNYLLLDPRITQDLPNRADNLGNFYLFFMMSKFDTYIFQICECLLGFDHP